MTEEAPGRAALTDEFLAQVRSAFANYEGPEPSRRRLGEGPAVREISKNYAPELLGEVDRLFARRMRCSARRLIRVVNALAEVESNVIRQAKGEQDLIRGRRGPIYSRQALLGQTRQ